MQWHHQCKLREEQHSRSMCQERTWQKTLSANAPIQLKGNTLITCLCQSIAVALESFVCSSLSFCVNARNCV